ncbi:UDP-N-acetylmuramoyl-L-alanyl-D-glutamate--2,6-diaminopimelate ligase [Fusobacterium gastrosuis]|uniref:UDP-N-acetylmuramoyl-L-alanyl-D-glutamate--2, 6-diaminopimelate ligase n=1 Tax=Fusobacterium gastrosuis TaxID=1755100 RepID=UPI0029704ACF|nr:UDP-N-acetylmuramoyl-L-alanyl-D-glutamate--2,6-diaminopimelate ligase [Fusobacteriaceae bacterium]MDY5713283.1 UDP-N-acetylmuramoyl-L-alanyl-D-glutamate--2,6-diaminopimelate ligase [Fusobacterium gastrosuis]
MNIFSGIEYRVLKNIDLEREYCGIEYDSRKIKENFIFIALEGANVDGHNYIDVAVKNGATCIIVSKEVELKHNVSYVMIENLRQKLGYIASNFFGWPQKKLTIVGVTGTNGKTSSTYMIEKLLGNKKITRIGTIEYKIDDEVIEAVNTTPESLDLIKIFDKSLKKGIDCVIMEVSSHSLELGRVETLDFDYAMFTNLTQDHLDYHQNMENYFLAKRKLFLKLKDKNNSVINIDDTYGQRLYKEFLENSEDILSYGINNGDLHGEFLENDSVKIKFKEKEFVAKYKLLGDFNLYNTLGAIGIVLKMGEKLEDIIKRLEILRPAPGRFETVDCGQDYKVIVDYAHTPDALENVIKVAKNIKNRGDVITIFGCGGDRDRTKRPLMANIAEKNSDIVILTEDNPRTENPEQIFNDVKKGFINIERHIFEPEREEAIKKAISIAKKNDIILITGKGHETYHIKGLIKYHFDDKEIARREIVRRKMKEKN